MDEKALQVLNESQKRRRHPLSWHRVLSLLLPTLLFLGLAAAAIAHQKRGSEMEVTTALAPKTPVEKRAVEVQNRTVLECFQVAQPVLGPSGPTTPDSGSEEGSGACTVQVMEYVFGNSYGAPYVGEYTPPSCQFNRVVLNFTATSAGRQYDRLALMYLGDTEVWRTSTAEPTTAPGIRWTYLKDVTPYLSLWKQPQKVIFDLGNIVNDIYTGPFNTTLTATFLWVEEEEREDANETADQIIPISARKSSSNAGSHWTLPTDNATNTISDFPRNARRAVFSVSANGQADEEFWWSNVPQNSVDAFAATAGSLPGYSNWREVQVWIDGQLAGVQWPFPVVFTGGVVPGLHRPIVGEDVFDLREHEIDITPWLPVLCDGQSHVFTIEVVGLDSPSSSLSSCSASLSQAVGNSWYVTGKIFVWLDDDDDAITTGDRPVVTTSTQPRIQQSLGQNATGANETLEYFVRVTRDLTVEGRVRSQTSDGPVSWTQQLSYASQNEVSAYGFDQINTVSLSGADKAIGSLSVYTSDYSFPIVCNTTYTADPIQGNLTLWAHLQQGLDLQVSGDGVFPTGLEAFGDFGRSFHGGSRLSTSSDGTAAFYQSGDGRSSSGFGSTTQTLRFGGLSVAGALGASPDVPLYTRTVSAVNGTVTADDEQIWGQPKQQKPNPSSSQTSSTGVNQFAQAPLQGGTGPRVFMGRAGTP